MQDPSLVVVPYRYKSAKLYSEIPISGIGDFTVGRLLNTATRVNFNGNIEVVNANIPRLDYYTSGGTAGCPALLVEASAQNLCLQSQDFTTTWSPTNLNTTSGFTSPTNSNLGTLIEATANTARIRQTFTAGLTSGVTSTFSLFAKLGTQSSGVTLVFQEGTGTNFVSGVCQSFRLDTGAVGTSGTLGAGFTFIRSGIENYGNGWYRCSLTVQLSYTPSSANLTIRPTSTVTANLPVTASGDTCYIFGAQLETGSVATSYIPTTTAAVTRNADVVNLSGAVSGCIGQTEGTIYCEFEYKTNATERRLIALSNGTISDRIMVWTQNNTLYAEVEDSEITLANPITEGYHKLAFAYQQNGVSGTLFASLDGGAVVSGTSADFPASLTDINIGKNEATATSTFFWNARIRAVALYNSRLDDADLMVLTSPTYYSNVRDMIWDTFVARTSTFSELPGCLQTRHNELITL
jgi:hypothetical protein